MKSSIFSFSQNFPVLLIIYQNPRGMTQEVDLAAEFWA